MKTGKDLDTGAKSGAQMVEAGGRSGWVHTQQRSSEGDDRGWRAESQKLRFWQSCRGVVVYSMGGGLEMTNE